MCWANMQSVAIFKCTLRFQGWQFGRCKGGANPGSRCLDICIAIVLEEVIDLGAPSIFGMIIMWPEPAHAQEFNELVATIGGCVKPIFGSHMVSANAEVAADSTPSILRQNREDPDEEC